MAEFIDRYFTLYGCPILGVLDKLITTIPGALDNILNHLTRDLDRHFSKLSNSPR